MIRCRPLFFLVVACLLLSPTLPARAETAPAPAQQADTYAVILAEGFDEPTFPPPGWSQHSPSAYDPELLWRQVTYGTSPLIQPHSGAGMAQFNSYDSDRSYVETRLVTPAFAANEDLTLSFWMSHDAAMQFDNDTLKVQVSVAGGSYQNLGATINRYNAACQTACWKRYTFSLAAYTGQQNVRVALLGRSDQGMNIYVDDFIITGPTSSFVHSTKAAPAFAVLDEGLTYTLTLVNSGNAPAPAASLVDPLPPGAAYLDGSLACTSGLCAYDPGLHQIGWTGSVAVNEQVQVAYTLSIAGMPCGADLKNEAVITDPFQPQPVTISATTQTRFMDSILEESFEGGARPAGWTHQVVATGGGTSPAWNVTRPASLPSYLEAPATHTGSYYLYFNSDATYSNAAARIATHPLEIPANQPGEAGSQFSFWMFHTSSFMYSQTRVQVQVSTDDGATYANLGAPIHLYDSACLGACWAQHTFSLSDYAGQTIRIGLLGISDGWLDTYVDDLTVNLPWAPCPVQQFSPSSAAASACPGSWAAPALTLQNFTPAADEFNLSPGGLWESAVLPNLVALGPGQAQPVDLQVKVPWYAEPLSTQLTTLTAQPAASVSTFSAGAQVTADLFTGTEPLPGNPHQTQSSSLVYTGGKLYKIGGFESYDRIRSHVDIFDPAAGTWSAGAPLPDTRTYLKCAALDEHIYCAGGYNEAGYHRTLFVYDPAANSWSVSPHQLPVSTDGKSLAALNGELYLVGTGNEGYAAYLWVFNPLNGWRAGPAMPQARREPSAAALGGKLVVAGGSAPYGQTHSTVNALIFDPATALWTTGAPAPHVVSRAASTAYQDRYLFLIGGQMELDGSMISASVPVMVYDLLEDRWVTQQSLMSGQTFATAASDDDNIWISDLSNPGTYQTTFTSQVTLCPDCPPPTGWSYARQSPLAVTHAPVYFQAAAESETPVVFTWDFGDGTTAEGAEQVHSYAQPGEYTVTLTLTNCYGANTQVETDTFTIELRQTFLPILGR